MSEQKQIIEKIQALVLVILKNGSVTEEEGLAIDELEEELHEHNSFKESQNNSGTLQGEEIATLFFQNKFEDAVRKLIEYKITPPDFFAFIEYHYDEEHPDEELLMMFTQNFVKDVYTEYAKKA